MMLVRTHAIFPMKRNENPSKNNLNPLQDLLFKFPFMKLFTINFHR